MGFFKKIKEKFSNNVEMEHAQEEAAPSQVVEPYKKKTQQMRPLPSSEETVAKVKAPQAYINKKKKEAEIGEKEKTTRMFEKARELVEKIHADPTREKRIIEATFVPSADMSKFCAALMMIDPDISEKVWDQYMNSIAIGEHNKAIDRKLSEKRASIDEFENKRYYVDDNWSDANIRKTRRNEETYADGFRRGSREYVSPREALNLANESARYASRGNGNDDYAQRISTQQREAEAAAAMCQYRTGRNDINTDIYALNAELDWAKRESGNNPNDYRVKEAESKIRMAEMLNGLKRSGM